MKAKRIFGYLIAAVMTLLVSALPVAAFSETEPRSGAALVLGATVSSGAEIAVKAPASGALAPFTVRAGDTLAAGETAFAIEPKTLYAQTDGTIAAVYVKPGDIADAAVARYGAAMQLERVNRWEISANVTTGYNSDANRDPRVGWQVWLRSANEKRFADGEIIAVTGKSFTVEVRGGDLQFTDDVKIYRTPDYDSKSLLGRAKPSALSPDQLTISGTVLSVAVRAGDAVKAGDPLMTYAPDALAPERRGAEDALAAKADAPIIVTSVNVQQGASVQKDQTLCVGCRADALELLATAEEGDLSRVFIGAKATVSFVEIDAQPMTATVIGISALGASGDTATYEVRLAFDAPENARLGMHATVEFE